jgi:uncharacterized OB-fold protein
MPEPRPVVPGLFVDAGDGPRLLAARCAACARPHFPAGPVCPYCGDGACTPLRVGPAGTLRLFTVVSTRPPGYRGELPYGFGVVEVDGLCVVTRLTEARLERLRPGLPVRLAVVPLHADDDGTPVVTYAFRPLEEA